MSETDRLRWRCRRGMLELDHILAAFLKHRYGSLSCEEQAIFKALLSENDADLWAWIKGSPARSDYEGIVRHLRTPLDNEEKD